MLGFNKTPSNFELAKYPNTFLSFQTLKNGLIAEAFDPVYTIITGVTNSKGIYQRCFGIVHVFIRFQSTGAFAVPINSTIKLPIKPYFFNGVYPFAAHNFEFSNVVTGATQKCWMDTATGLIRPVALIAASANNWVLSGYYLTE